MAEKETVEKVKQFSIIVILLGIVIPWLGWFIILPIGIIMFFRPSYFVFLFKKEELQTIGIESRLATDFNSYVKYFGDLSINYCGQILEYITPYQELRLNPEIYHLELNSLVRSLGFGNIRTEMKYHKTDGNSSSVIDQWIIRGTRNIREFTGVNKYKKIGIVFIILGVLTLIIIIGIFFILIGIMLYNGAFTDRLFVNKDIAIIVSNYGGFKEVKHKVAFKHGETVKFSSDHMFLKTRVTCVVNEKSNLSQEEMVLVNNEFKMLVKNLESIRGQQNVQLVY